MTLASAMPAPKDAGNESDCCRKGYVLNKKSGSFHTTWVRCYMVVKEGSVSLYAVSS